MVTKLAIINGFDTTKIWSVGDSSTDLSMKIPGSHFIGFNPARERAKDAFIAAEVPIIEDRNLTQIWSTIFNESFPNTID
jgi:phosphoserine phosphatase